ncbi:hypothetical protein FPV67DRAFT_1649763 [Lyophyllum atratum]|nr:hypothetical protein FPV67DRAFT_1649763 [Lyophyllum atratum]
MNMMQFLSSATHEILLQSGNRTYNELFLKKMSLEAELTGVRSSYDLLLKSIPTSAATAAIDGGLGLLTQTASSSRRVAYLKEDYSLMKFWTEKEWNAYKKSKKNDDASINQRRKGRFKDHDANREALAYVENEYGVPITEKQAAELCLHARSIFEYLATVGMAPKSWGKASKPAVQYYLDNIYRDHDELRLGEGNWKAYRLATDLYPGWARGRKDMGGTGDAVKCEPGDAVKIEPGEVESDKGAQGTSKRKDPPTSSTGPAKQTKKTKEDIAASSQQILSTTASLLVPESAVPINTDVHTPSPPPRPQPDQLVIDPLLSNSPLSTADASTLFIHAEPGSLGISAASSAPANEGPTSSHVPGSHVTIPEALDEMPAGTSVMPSSVSHSGQAHTNGGLVAADTCTKTAFRLVDPFDPAPPSDRPTSRIVALNGRSDPTPSSNDTSRDGFIGVSTTGHLPHDAPSSNSVQTAGTISTTSHPGASTTTTPSSSTTGPSTAAISSSPSPAVMASSAPSEPGQSTAASALFKPSKTSCSELNLFGTEYFKTHVRPTKPEVKAAFEALSEVEKLHWKKLRTEMLAAKKSA